MPDEKIFYLTEEGLAKIKKEFKRLEELRFAKTIYSDEYLEIRFADLKKILENSKLIKPPSKEKQNTVNLGAIVLVSVDGQDDEFSIVGPLEANPSIGRISNESPVGKVLLGHRAGDRIVISSPVKTVYKIKKINYGKSA